MKDSWSHLLIKIPPNNTKDPTAMVKFLEAVHRTLSSGSSLSLEILAKSNFLHFYISVKQEYQKYIESQLYANYDDIEIQKTKDWFDNLKNPIIKEIKFSKDSFFPLITFYHLKDDPLNSLSTYIEKLEKDEVLFIQLSLARIGEYSMRKQLKGSYFFMSRSRYGKDGKPSPAYYKYQQHLYKGRLRIGFCSNSLTTSKNQLEIVGNNYKQIKGSFNKLTPINWSLWHSHKKLIAIAKKRGVFFRSDYWLSAEVATIYHFPYTQGTIANIVQTTSRKAPPPDTLPKEGSIDPKTVSFFGKTNYRDTGVKFGIKRVDRRRHLYIVGKTGSGKSKLLELLLAADINNGEGCCLIDPHGDLAEDVLKYVPKKRIKDIIYINPADRDFPIGFNALEYTDDYENRQHISRFFIAIFKKIFANDWNERMEHVLRYIILALLETRDSNVLGITRILYDANYRQRVIKEITDPVVQAFWANEFAGYNEQYSAQAIVPLMNKVGQFVANPIIRNMIGQQKNIIDFENFMNDRKVIIINLSKGKIGDDNAALLGSMFITKIQQAALARAKMPEEERADFYFYIDEFQNFATEAFDSILSEARKYRLNLTIAHQYIDQLPEDIRSTVFGNVASIIIFAVGGRDAEYLAKEYAPVFQPDDMIAMEAREMYIKMIIDGRMIKPFSGRTLSVKKPESDYSTDVRNYSRKKYASNRLSVENAIKRWSSAEKLTSITEETEYPEPII